MSELPKIVRKTLSEHVAACKRVTCFPAEMPARVAEAVEALGGAPSGPPAVLYHALNDDGTVDAEICVPVEASADAAGFRVKTLPGGEALSITHRGPYGSPGDPDGLGSTIAVLRDYVRAHEVALAEDPMRRVLHESVREHADETSKHVTELQLLLFLPKWLGWFAEGLERAGGPRVREHVMEGYERLAEELEPDAKAAWARGAMERLDESIDDPDVRRCIMNACAHRFPRETIERLREEYLRVGSLDALLERMGDESLYRGARFHRDPDSDGNVLTCVKVPADAEAYRAAETPIEKRVAACHCPFVRPTIRSGETLSPTFCNCGGGWYVQLWEGIVGGPVVVDVDKSVSAGDDCCRFVIRLPDDA